VLSIPCWLNGWSHLQHLRCPYEKKHASAHNLVSVCAGRRSVVCALAVQVLKAKMEGRRACKIPLLPVEAVNLFTHSTCCASKTFGMK